MTQAPEITARIVMLSPEEGGRITAVFAQTTYRPHLVVEQLGDPPSATPWRSPSHGEMLGVWFLGDGRELHVGVQHELNLALLYAPRVDYGALQTGATFSIREGDRVVGYGRVVQAEEIARQSHVYASRFRDTDLLPDDEDHEWVACLVIDASSPEAAQDWGDHLARGMCERNPSQQFLSSEIRDMDDPLYADADLGDLPRVRVGEEPTDDEIGW